MKWTVRTKLPIVLKYFLRCSQIDGEWLLALIIWYAEIGYGCLKKIPYYICHTIWMKENWLNKRITRFAKPVLGTVHVCYWFGTIWLVWYGAHYINIDSILFSPSYGSAWSWEVQGGFTRFRLVATGLIHILNWTWELFQFRTGMVH